MIIRAYSVFEHIVYHCGVIDARHPCRPVLEVDAVVRPGDVDDGPLLVPLADYVTLAGGPEHVAECIRAFRHQGRIRDHLGVAHITFPFWTPVHLETPPTPPPRPAAET